MKQVRSDGSVGLYWKNKEQYGGQRIIGTGPSQLGTLKGQTTVAWTC